MVSLKRIHDPFSRKLIGLKRKSDIVVGLILFSITIAYQWAPDMISFLPYMGLVAIAVSSHYEDKTIAEFDSTYGGGESVGS